MPCRGQFSPFQRSLALGLCIFVDLDICPNLILECSRETTTAVRMENLLLHNTTVACPTVALPTMSGHHLLSCACNNRARTVARHDDLLTWV